MCAKSQSSRNDDEVFAEIDATLTDAVANLEAANARVQSLFEGGDLLAAADDTPPADTWTAGNEATPPGDAPAGRPEEAARGDAPA